MKSVASAVLLLALLSVTGCGDEQPAVDAVPAWAEVAPEQIAEAEKHGVPVAFDNDLGMRFVLIPAGAFVMGSPEDERHRDDDEIQHEVTIPRPFYLATTETTQAAWKRVMGRNPSIVRGDALPVMHVLWDECQTFVKRLNGTAPSGYRLPTEAEWEYACRAGTKTTYWSGNDESDLAKIGWYKLNADGKAHAVGGKPSSPWGLHDMHGNVWEWCEDYWVRSYDGAPDDGSARMDQGPRWHSGHGKRVIRGGSWHLLADYGRSASRFGAHPGSLNYGFRLAITVTPHQPPATATRVGLQVPDAVAPGTRTRPEDVVRLWLHAAKRGDAEAMVALWAEEHRQKVRTASWSRAADVAAGKFRPTTWRLGVVGGRDLEPAVTVHVHGHNLEFLFEEREGQWRIVTIRDFD